MIKKEIKVFFAAIMFYTRIPVPKSTGYSDENLNKTTRYLPIIGIIVGVLGAFCFWVANQVLSQQISIVASLICMVILTGAFHEDAISDFCDGFGGGYTKEKILSIMKDSRIGTYGAIAIVLLFLSKITLLNGVSSRDIPFLLISAHALSRLAPVFLIYTSVYVSDPLKSKSKPIGKKVTFTSLIVACIFGLAPMAIFNSIAMLCSCLLLTIVFLYYRNYIHRKIGGYTGDVLGALQQISEITIYIAFIVSSKYF